ncbi:MAG: glycosyltransferase family 4 protein [Candidatus Cloacimonetes bacterium]|nr:glycosyltransferase family 4 protein [Candidatus Cloacimonadota bacterium]
MNILIFNIKHNWGGITTEDEIIIREFKRLGHVVIVVARPKAKFALQSAFKDKFITFKPGAYFNLISILKVIKIIKKQKIDLVITNTDKEISIAGVAAKICGIPNIRRAGSSDDLSDQRRFFTIMEKKLITINLMPSQSVFDQAYQTNKKIDKKNYIPVYTGKTPIFYDLKEIEELKKSWGIKEGEKVLGITCQLAKIKAIPDLINVFSRLIKIHTNLKLVITGDGNEKEYLLQMTNDLQLNDKIFFTGFTKTPQLHAAAYDICLHTSHSEGIPNVLYEYLTVQKPIIISKVGGIPEVVKHEHDCLLYEPGDLDTLCHHIETVLIKPEIAQKIAVNASETAKIYTIDRFISQLLEIFNEYIKRSKT